MDDLQIVGLYWARNELAIPATSEKYGAYCMSIAVNILGDREDAKECVNDVYWKAWNAIPPQRPYMLSTFLGKITRNLAINRYKHDRAQKRGGGVLPLVLDELAELVSGREDVERETDRRELIDAINDFLDALPDKKRDLFVCRYWYFDPVSDLARRFGMTQNHVSVTLGRLRAKLRTELEKRGFML